MSAPRARPPAPLPGRARAMLTAYRDAQSIPSAVEERIWSVVGADDAPEPAFDPLDDQAQAVPHAGRRGLAYVGAALAAAAVLVLAWRLGGTLAERREAERTPGTAVMQGERAPSRGRAVVPAPSKATPEEHEPDPASNSVPLADDAATTAVAPTPEPAAPPTRARPGGSRSAEPPSPPPGEPTPEPTSTFAAERELVASAWRALALGEHEQALQAAAEHARRFPSGLLVPERAAIETIARCRATPQEGPQRASAFHRAHPRSPLAARVDEACEEKSGTP